MEPSEDDGVRRYGTPLSEIGNDPDPRFTLANERTFLAWTRTSLALLATGLAIAEFADSLSRPTRLAIAIPLMLLGSVVSAMSFRRWQSVERALRTKQPLPYPALPRLLGGAIAIIALAACIVLIVNG
jgi:putative membrane protein